MTTIDLVEIEQETTAGPPSRPFPWEAVLGGLALVGAVVAIRTCSLGAIDDLGLVSALGPWFWAAAVAWAVAFVIALARPEPSGRTLALLLIGGVVVLYGLPGFVEPNPRYFSAWLHVGFMEHIARTDQLVPSYDSRFSWPGFLSLGASAIDTASPGDGLWMIRFFPVVVNLVYLAAVAALAKTATRDRRVVATAAAIFMVGNWFGQDYLSPQAVGLVVWLAVVLIALRVFPTASRLVAPVGRRAWMASVVRRDHEPDGAAPIGGDHRLGLAAVAIGLVVVLAASHQLTPVMTTVTLAALAIGRRTMLRTLPLIAAVATVGWLSFGAEAFWKGHISLLLGGVGDVSGNVSSGLTARATGVSPARQAMLDVRVVVTLFLVLVAVAGWVRCARRGRVHGALALLLVVPWLMVGAQAYGGEMFMRAGVFSLPAASVLGALGLWAGARAMASRQAGNVQAALGLSSGGVVRPSPRTRPMPRRRIVRGVVAVIALVALMTTFVVARYGNESFEMVRPGERSAITWLYDNAPDGSLAIASSRSLAWRYERLLEIQNRPLGDEVFEGAVAYTRVAAQHDGPTYLILSTGQSLFATALYGYPEGWGEDLRSGVAATGQWELVFSSPDAEVWHYTGPGVS